MLENKIEQRVKEKMDKTKEVEMQKIKTIVVYNQVSFFGLRYLEMFCCKGYLIALQEFKRNE